MKTSLTSAFASVLTTLLTISAASAVDSPITAKFDNSASFNVSGDAAMEIYRSLSGVPTATERSQYSETINSRRGENVFCTEMTFVGVGSTTTYNCAFTATPEGLIIPGQAEDDSFVGPDAPRVAEGTMDASPIPGTYFVNVQITGLVAARFFHFMNRAQEKLLLDGKVIYRTGKNVSCVRTKNARRSNDRCLLTSNERGVFTPDNTFLVQPMSL
ncbi:MAG: hypothetical protein EOP04_25385 [Proteobacteria bacterium]|nr:MAG: hypothetical protein EOP04_25385 [Pseudomonadota bacterium]